MSNKANWLRRMKKKLDRTTKLMLYKTLIVPHIDYCSSVLFLCNNEDLKALQKVQNVAMRAILNESLYAHIDEMLDALNILSVNQQIHFNVLYLLYKAKLGFLPNYIARNLINIRDVQPYPLRRNSLYLLPPMMTPAAQNSLYYKGLKLFNDFIANTDLENHAKKDKKVICEYVKINIPRFC